MNKGLVGCVLRTIAEVSDLAMALWAFNPHLTLGRVKSPANREKLAGMLKNLPPLDWPPFEVKELTLFQSVLSPQGSKYPPLKAIPLGK
jgi:RNA 2',3'-cyclic 3'-phosphodiesterase